LVLDIKNPIQFPTQPGVPSYPVSKTPHLHLKTTSDPTWIFKILQTVVVSQRFPEKLTAGGQCNLKPTTVFKFISILLKRMLTEGI